MPLFRSRRRAPVATTTRTTRTTSARKPSLFYRLTHSSRKTHPVSTVGTTSRHGTTRSTHRSRHAPVAVARKPTFGDKIHGAAKVMAGTLTFNRRKKHQGEAMQVQGTATTTSRRRRRW